MPLRGAPLPCLHGRSFFQATLEQIRAASDIVDVIGSYVPLKRAGANFVALCPFHKEKSPSFNVNPHKQIFHCFGCHKGGDVFTFVKEYENIPFPDAVRRLAERAKIPLGNGEQSRPAAKPPSSRTACSKSTSKSPSAGRTPSPTKPPARSPAIISPTRRLRRSRQTVPPRLRAGPLGRHRQLGQKQRPRASRVDGTGRADPAQGRRGRTITTAFAGG